MPENLPPCPQCQSEYTYEDREQFVCPECGHEWSQGQSQDTTTDELVVKDANGTPLQQGDYVVLTKDLKIKGSSSVVKVGTKVKVNHLVDGDHNIDCKIKEVGKVMLKSEFVKKA